MAKNKNEQECPCGSGELLDNCCGPYIEGVSVAPTAEALMRSRYSAYVLKRKQYLLDSWHHSTRPEHLELDEGQQWRRLKILSSDERNVEFVATFRLNGKAHKLHERSRFVFEDGRWFYLDGEMAG